MVIKIYDWDNKCVELEVPDKEIVNIMVNVITGDETGYINFVDGGSVEFDASDCRIEDFYDGSYVVSGENIEKWINFEPIDGRTISYLRHGKFTGLEE